MTIQEINKVLQEVRQAKTEVDLLLRQIEEMKEEGNQMEFWNKANVINNKLSL